MLREPGSRYEAGRSSTLLKVKRFLDAEARVVEHLAGAGRHKGRLGALGVVLPDGTQFSVGTGFSDAQTGKPSAGRQPDHVPLSRAVGSRRSPLPIVYPGDVGEQRETGFADSAAEINQTNSTHQRNSTQGSSYDSSF